MPHYLRLLLQLVMSPARGWEDIADGAGSARRALLHGLIPLSAIAAITVYTGMFYQHGASFGALTVDAVVTFLKYSVSYFVAVAAMTYVLPRLTTDGLVNREYAGLFSAYCLGIMAAIGIIENLLPMEVTLLQFLPIYMVVVICRGRKFMDVDASNIFSFAALGVFCTIVPVFFIDWLMQHI